MNVGPMSGVVNSAAGAPLSQTSGSETERTQKDSSASQRQVENDKKASDAAGVGQTEQDEGAAERDADGRRFWEAAPGQPQEPADDLPEAPRQSKDPSGSSGNSLDLTG